MPGSEVPFTNPLLNDAEAVKIEALAEDLFNAGHAHFPYDNPDWGEIEPSDHAMWVRFATTAQDRIDAAATNWTRVEDGLPTLPGDYLVTRVWSPDGHVIVSQTLFHPPCAWECYGVLAWAPLPEPWRG